MLFGFQNKQKNFDVDTAWIVLKDLAEAKLNSKCIQYEKNCYLILPIYLGKHGCTLKIILDDAGAIYFRCLLPVKMRPNLFKLSWAIWSASYAKSIQHTGLELVANQICMQPEDIDGILDYVLRDLKHPTTEKQIDECFQ